MTEDDTLAIVAGEAAGDNANPSEATANTEAKKDEAGTPDNGAAKEGAETAGEPAGDEPPKKPSGSARKAERIRELEARLAELEARAAKPADEAKPPKLEDFPDWDSHQAALMEFAARKALKETSRVTAEEELGTVREAVIREQIAAHEARVAEARERIPDYDKTLATYRASSAQKPTEAVTALLLESDKSELLAYHLATRADLVRELNSMNPVAAARRIGQIEARLSYPQPKKQSDAPPPVAGLRGAASSSPDNLGFDELKAMFARK